MKLNQAIELFEPISLAQMDGVKLMKRTDRKFWFRKELLVELLQDVRGEYYALELGGERSLPYSTLYYDTPSDKMYNEHHRAKRGRYKIRRRSYLSSGIGFLEVKYKNNKGRTIKCRRPSSSSDGSFDELEKEFVAQNSPYNCSELSEVVESRFNRITLVSRNMDERCTIDTQLAAHATSRLAELSNLVIVEVKSQGRSRSAMIEALASRRIREAGFSKYCASRCLTNDRLKRNNFKERLRAVEKEMSKSVILNI